MNYFSEEDLIRPLGLVTLNFGYAEGELMNLLTVLSKNGLEINISSNASLGQKVFQFTAGISELNFECINEIKAVLNESRLLIEKRNSLIHASIFTKGRVVPNDNKIQPFIITPGELTSLANEIHNWKERLNSIIQRQLVAELLQQKRST